MLPIVMRGFRGEPPFRGLPEASRYAGGASLFSLDSQEASLYIPYPKERVFHGSKLTFYGLLSFALIRSEEKNETNLHGLFCIVLSPVVVQLQRLVKLSTTLCQHHRRNKNFH